MDLGRAHERIGLVLLQRERGRRHDRRPRRADTEVDALAHQHRMLHAERIVADDRDRRHVRAEGHSACSTRSPLSSYMGWTVKECRPQTELRTCSRWPTRPTARRSPGCRDAAHRTTSCPRPRRPCTKCRARSTERRRQRECRRRVARGAADLADAHRRGRPRIEGNRPRVGGRGRGHVGRDERPRIGAGSLRYSSVSWLTRVLVQMMLWTVLYCQNSPPAGWTRSTACPAVPFTGRTSGECRCRC